MGPRCGHTEPAADGARHPRGHHLAVTVSGRSTAFEAVVNIEVRQDGTLTPLAATTAMGGSNGQMGPFSKAVAFAGPEAPRGAIVVKTISAKDGTTAEATVIRVLLS